jgi:hypothetical protein
MNVNRRSSASLLAAACLLAATACGSTVAGGVRATTGAYQPGLGQPPSSGQAESNLQPADGGGPQGGGGGAGTSGSLPLPGTATNGTASGQPGHVQGPSSAGPRRPAPITIGVFDQDNPSAAVGAVGGQGSVSVSAADIVKALVRYFNAHGGIAGHRVTLVEYTLQTTHSDWRVDAEAACADFTQDHHVQVALSTVGGGVFLDNYQACLQHAGVPDIHFGSVGGKQSFDQFPMMFGSVFAAVDDAAANQLNQLHSSGYLTPKNKIGVVMENCNYDTFAYSHTVAPLAKQLGLNIVRTQSVNCLNGYGDVGAFAAQVQSAVLPFRSAGVDRVMFLSTWESLALLFFDKQATSQSYPVGYALTSNAAIAVNASNFSPTSLAHMQGVGWWPAADIDKAPVTPPAARCNAMAAAEGLDAGSSANRVLIDLVCDPFLMLEAALGHVPATVSAPAVVAAVEGLGRSFASSTTIGGATALSATHRDQVVTYQRFGYQASCSCFRYS